MENKHLWKVLSKLQKTLKKNRKSERKKYLNSCTDDEIHAICGACKNLLSNNIKINEKKKAYLRKKLAPIKEEIREISKPQTSVKKKRDLLKRDQIGKGVFSLLARTI